MKRLAAAMILAAATAWSSEMASTLTVCIQAGSDPLSTIQAQDVARRLLLSVGVRLHWQGMNHCPDDAVRINFSDNTPAAEKPGALAYAHAFEGIHIVVLHDRILTVVPPQRVGRVMGYVLAHEIGHMLQGTDRHSVSGVMKANYTADDYGRMAVGAIQFEPRDGELIRSGLSLRQARFLASR